MWASGSVYYGDREALRKSLGNPHAIQSVHQLDIMVANRDSWHANLKDLTA